MNHLYLFNESINESLVRSLFLVQFVLFLSPLAIPYLKWLKPALFVAHFYNMNLALLIGFLRYVKGVKSSVWQPTPRSKN